MNIVIMSTPKISPVEEEKVQAKAETIKKIQPEVLTEKDQEKLSAAKETSK